MFFFKGSPVPPPCPTCGGQLKYRDNRKRIYKQEGGECAHIVVNRYRCEHCGHLHTCLPDILAPHKHYGTEVIAGVLDDVVTADDLDSEDYPCTKTMERWQHWFTHNRDNIEGYLRSAQYKLSDFKKEVLFYHKSWIPHIRQSSQKWLESIIRVIYNQGGILLPS
ncbi:MAG: DUF6431 domain-containing protein [Prevotella sp.]